VKVATQNHFSNWVIVLSVGFMPRSMAERGKANMGNNSTSFSRDFRKTVSTPSNVFIKGEGWMTAPKRPKNIAMPYQWLFKQKKLDLPNRLNGAKVLDYGCGRGQDAKRLGFARYDPNWFPDTPFDPVRIPNTYDFIFSIYVLDVISDVNDRLAVVDDCRRLLKDDGEIIHIVRVDEYATMADGRANRQTVDSSELVHRIEPADFYGCTEIYRNYFFACWVSKKDGPHCPEGYTPLAEPELKKADETPSDFSTKSESVDGDSWLERVKGWFNPID